MKNPTPSRRALLSSLSAALLLLAAAAARADTTTVPAYRMLQAAGPLAPPGNAGKIGIYSSAANSQMAARTR